MDLYAVKIQTTNDSSGRPRRGWLIYDPQSELIGFADEDYDSRATVFARVERAMSRRPLNEIGCVCVDIIRELCVLNVPAGEYRTARRHVQL